MTSTQKIELGGSNFEEFITSNLLLVDKTLLIKDIIDGSNKVLLITRPRRWGKSLNMSMLDYFFKIPSEGQKVEEKTKIFSKMKIAEDSAAIEKYCGQYPTIFVSFKDIKESTYEEIERGIKEIISNLYRLHEYLSQSQNLNETEKALFKKFLTKEFDSAELKNGIFHLSRMLHAHFGKKVFIFIDEYDASMNDWYANALAREKVDDESNQLLQRVLLLFSSIFGAALKDNPHLEKSVVTGILRVAKASLFSGLNNLGEDSILDHRYAKHFGFTDEEVTQLLKTKNDGINIEELKEWYNGYTIGGFTIYNPWSIMCYLDKKETKAYWVTTGNTTLLSNAFITEQFHEEIRNLINGKIVNTTVDSQIVFSDIQSSSDAFYSLLLFSGYLTVTEIKQEKAATYNCEVKIPNTEVLEVFEKLYLKRLDHKFHITLNGLERTINPLLKGEVDIFLSEFKNLIDQVSYFSTSSNKAEVFYQAYMIGIMCSIPKKQYRVEPEMESGDGRIDLAIIPTAKAIYKNAFIFELKKSDEQNLGSIAQTALNQINDRRYVTKIRNYEGVEKIIKIGLAFCGKNMEMKYDTEIVTR